jgi:hypothetical protein
VHRHLGFLQDQNMHSFADGCRAHVDIAQAHALPHAHCAICGSSEYDYEISMRFSRQKWKPLRNFSL